MTNNYTKINNVLSNWDPIGVGYPLSQEEYKQYVPMIASCIKNVDILKKTLIHILESIGLKYSPDNRDQEEDLRKIIELLSKLS